MNPSPDVVEQVLWLGLYLCASLFLLCVVAVALGTFFTRLEAKAQEQYLIPKGGINSDVEREKGKLVVQGKDVGNE